MSMMQYQQIWQTVRKIPHGNVASYGQVADLAGLPGRARLVGRALKSTPKEQPVPWHRVLRSSGHIAFPQGSELAQTQKNLLQDEGVSVIRNRVSLAQFGWQPTVAELVMELTF